MVPELTLALSHYDRFVPLYDGTVGAEGYGLRVLHVSQSNQGRHGSRRHERMLRDGEFDVCELSLSSYLMARDRGQPFTAIPFFPRRLFSASQLWVNVDAGVSHPKDLEGRAVGLGTFQTTLSVLAIGDIWSEYGVDWKAISWKTDHDEGIPFSPPDGVDLTRLPDGRDVGEMLDAGELAAVFRPHPPKPVLRGSRNIRRLFDDPMAEEARYFGKNGFYPIMHVIAFRDAVLAEHPGAARAMMDAFVEADAVSARFYDDPNWSRLAWGRHYVERERAVLGDNPWPAGIDANRANLERFIGYSHELGLIADSMPVDSLFA